MLSAQTSRRLLTHSRLERNFSRTLYSNQRIKAIVEWDNKKYAYDYDLPKYGDITREYLRKRWTARHEICTLCF